MRRNTIADFWARVDQRGPDECWHFTGTPGTRGYRVFWFDNRVRPAHVFAYEVTKGPVPDGLTVDHICHTDACTVPAPECPHRRCCNPAHLVLATSRENVLRGNGISAANARKERCPKCGGEYEVRPDTGTRWCRPCRRRWERERDHRIRHG